MQNRASSPYSDFDGKMTRFDASDSTSVVSQAYEDLDPDSCSTANESSNIKSATIRRTYDVVQMLSDTEVVEVQGDAGEYVTFHEAKEAALDYLQDVIDLCELTIDGFRDTDTPEQYFGTEVVADEKPDHDGNVQYICSGHYQPIPEAKEKPPQWFVGRLVKLLFPIPRRPDNGEYMWVQVQSHRGDELVGILANEPLHADHSYGDEIVFRPERIVALGSTDGVTA